MAAGVCVAARLEQPESSPGLRAKCGQGPAKEQQALPKAPEASPEAALGRGPAPQGAVRMHGGTGRTR